MPTPTGPRAPLIGTAELRDHLEDALDHWFAGTRGWLPAFDLIRRRSELVREAEDASYLREERRCGPFSRSLALPARFDATKIDTRLEDGVLEVTLPLRPGSDAEPIQIGPRQ